MKTCVIVDDEPLAIEIIKKYLADRKDIICVNSFTDPEEALNYLQQNPIDIVVLDIEMTISGLHFKKHIPSDCSIIFTTANPNYALEAFDQNAIDYLLKPVNPDRFNSALDKAILMINAINAGDLNKIKQAVITLKANKQIHKLLLSELVYIESLKEYLAYYTTTGKIIALGTLKDVYDTLPKETFVRIHKSFVINKDHITSYNSSTVIINQDINLTVGRMYKDEFMNSINK